MRRHPQCWRGTKILVKGCIWRSSSYFSNKIYKNKLLLHFNIRASLATKKFSNVEYEAEHLVSFQRERVEDRGSEVEHKDVEAEQQMWKSGKEATKGHGYRFKN